MANRLAAYSCGGSTGLESGKSPFLTDFPLNSQLRETRYLLSHSSKIDPVASLNVILTTSRARLPFTYPGHGECIPANCVYAFDLML
jgi:hypothetical protein